MSLLVLLYTHSMSRLRAAGKLKRVKAISSRKESKIFPWRVLVDGGKMGCIGLLLVASICIDFHLDAYIMLYGIMS